MFLYCFGYCWFILSSTLKTHVSKDANRKELLLVPTALLCVGTKPDHAPHGVSGYALVARRDLQHTRLPLIKISQAQFCCFFPVPVH